MTQELTVVVIGSTGKQGGAVARGLLGRGHKVRAVTRDPNSRQAKSLANAGATLVAASFDDTAPITKTLEGATSLRDDDRPEVRMPDDKVSPPSLGSRRTSLPVGSAVDGRASAFDASTNRPHRQVGVRATIPAPVFFMENLYFAKEQLAKGITRGAPADEDARRRRRGHRGGRSRPRGRGRFTGKRSTSPATSSRGMTSSPFSRVTGRPSPI
jgi:hypothetical protein